MDYTTNLVEVIDFNDRFTYNQPESIPIIFKPTYINDSYSFNNTTSESLFTISQIHLTVGFKTSSFLPLKRSPMYTPADFIASVGGLFGLFMGMSMLSVIELLYFCIIKLFRF